MLLSHSFKKSSNIFKMEQAGIVKGSNACFQMHVTKSTYAKRHSKGVGASSFRVSLQWRCWWFMRLSCAERSPSDLFNSTYLQLKLVVGWLKLRMVRAAPKRYRNEMFANKTARLLFGARKNRRNFGDSNKLLSKEANRIVHEIMNFCPNRRRLKTIMSDVNWWSLLKRLLLGVSGVSIRLQFVIKQHFP